MAKIKNAGYKKAWLALTPHEQFEVFCQGDAHSKNMWASDFSLWTAMLHDWTLKQAKPLDVFKKSKENSVEHDTQIAMRGALRVIFDCHRTGNATLLRDLADAIEAGKKPFKPAVDPQRAWLWSMFHPTSYNSSKPYVAKTFSQIRAAFDQVFDDGIADPQLREMVKEIGIPLARDKSGPKGPRIR